MPISDAEHGRALATILGADGLYLADEVRDVAAVLASHLIERFEAAYQVAHAYVDARDMRPPTPAELAELATGATTPEGAARLLAAAIRHAHALPRSQDRGGVIDPRDFTRRFQAGADLDALAAEHGLTRAQAEDVLRKHLPPCLYAEPAWPGRRRSR